GRDRRGGLPRRVHAGPGRAGVGPAAGRRARLEHDPGRRGSDRGPAPPGPGGPGRDPHRRTGRTAVHGRRVRARLPPRVPGLGPRPGPDLGRRRRPGRSRAAAGLTTRGRSVILPIRMVRYGVTFTSRTAVCQSLLTGPPISPATQTLLRPAGSCATAK